MSASSPLFPSKRTFISTNGTSAMCQRQTSHEVKKRDPLATVSPKLSKTGQAF